MTTSYAVDGALLRRFLTETARNRVTVAMLVVVPAVFVAAVGSTIADAGELLGGRGGPQAETATAGWTAGFVSAVAMYFQVRSARAADRRLVLAGLPAGRLVAARMASGLVLALVASAASYATLALRYGIDHPTRVAAGTLMFALVYLGLGAVVGALVANPVNGTVLILFVWLLDVIFGPAFRPADTLVSRAFPTHFLSLWLMDLPSRHGGRPGDLGWALLWLVVAVTTSWTAVSATSRTGRGTTRLRRGSAVAQLVAGVRAGLRQEGRNRVLWALLVVVPGLLIALSAVTTPKVFETMVLPEGGRDLPFRSWLPDTHPGLMAPIAVGALAALIGLFTALDARSADRRLASAGFRTSSLVTARLGVVAVLTLIATAASLAVAAVFFDASQWGAYVLANALIGLTYALVGVVIGWLFGRVGGVFVAFLLPFLDLAVEQSPMLNPEVSDLAHALPGYGASRVLYDAALTPSLDETGALIVAVAWLIGLTLVALVLLRRAALGVPAVRARSGTRC